MRSAVVLRAVSSKEPPPRPRFKTVIEEETLPSSRILPERPDHAMVTVLTGPHAGAMFRIDGDRNVIGRAADATIRLQDEGLSWHHASIRRLAGSYYLEDLGSTNGTFLGQERVRRIRLLEDGDRIGLGRHTVLKLELLDALEAEVSERLYESLVSDPLTGAYNRLAFDDRLKAELAFAARHRTEVSIIMVDLDHFKQINDNHGHPAGDRVLREVAETLGHAIRTEDMLARFGGEEFAIIARGISQEQAMVFAERLRNIVTYLHVVHHHEALPVTASFGVATATADRPIYTTEELIQAADTALYEAKRGGRNRVVGWRPPLH